MKFSLYLTLLANSVILLVEVVEDIIVFSLTTFDINDKQACLTSKFSFSFYN